MLFRSDIAFLANSKFRVYEFDGNSTISWVLEISFWILVAAGIVWSLITIIRTLRAPLEINTPPKELGFGTWPDPRTRRTGYAETTRELHKDRSLSSIGLALILLPTLVLAFCLIGLRSSPVTVAIDDGNLHLSYRLPWRNRTIPLSQIQDAQLERRSKRRKGLSSTWPVLHVDLGNERLEMQGADGSRYAAVEQAHRDLSSTLKRLSPATTQAK